jgi:lipoprotein-anchoring transpeptidase ErfK/SrfK
MTRITTLAAALLASAVAVTAASAAGPERRPGATGATIAVTKPGLSAAQAVTASAPNHRVAFVYDATEGEPVRTKGIVSYTNPSAGLYCLTVTGSISSGTVRNMVPQVTVWYEGGDFEVNLAYYVSSGCPSGRIGVLTKRLRSGSFVNSDFVGFTLLAP